LDLPTIWLYAAPPLIGGVIGYFTNDIAIRMLFRPYEPKFLGTWQIPFTPGVIPRNQARLGQRIADSITGSLLTPDEIEKIARRLLEFDRVQQAILWLLRLALDQVQSNKQQKTSEVLAHILEDLFSESLPKLLSVLAERDTFLQAQFDQIFDRVLLEFQFTDQQADQLARWILEQVLPPDVMRLLLIDFLTDRTIATIDDRFREKTSGTYWVVANLFGVRNSLVRLRSFCLEEREASNAILTDLVQSLNITRRLKESLQNLSLQNLPVSTVRQLRKTFGDTVRRFLQDQGVELLTGLSGSMDWPKVSRLLLDRLRKSDVMDTSLDLISADLARILERYLERDLESIVAEVLPILQLERVIVERIIATPPSELEAGLNDLVQTELQAIVNLGGVLGVLIGAAQSLSLLWR
jgi:uncharacterized membrane protein YheB (UPF0754 family)